VNGTGRHDQEATSQRHGSDVRYQDRRVRRGGGRWPATRDTVRRRGVGGGRLELPVLAPAWFCLGRSSQWRCTVLTSDIIASLLQQPLAPLWAHTPQQKRVRSGLSREPVQERSQEPPQRQKRNKKQEKKYGQGAAMGAQAPVVRRSMAPAAVDP